MTADHDHDQPHRRHAQAPDHESGPDTPDLAATLGNRGVERVLQSTSVQRSGATAHQELDEAVARSIESRRGGGTPLADDTRTEMEGALGADLQDVRVHTDGEADHLNRAVSAKAFTAGDDVFFRSGTYDPGSPSGKELIAHELTHVVQQRNGTSGLDAGQVSDPGDAAEREASAVGSEVASAGAASATETTAPAIARQADEELEDTEPLQMAVAREELPEEDVDEDGEPAS